MRGNPARCTFSPLSGGLPAGREHLLCPAAPHYTPLSTRMGARCPSSVRARTGGALRAEYTLRRWGPRSQLLRHPAPRFSAGSCLSKGCVRGFPALQEQGTIPALGWEGLGDWGCKHKAPTVCPRPPHFLTPTSYSHTVEDDGPTRSPSRIRALRAGRFPRNSERT